MTLDEDGCLLHDLPNGRRATIVPLTFDRYRICLLHPDCRYTYESVW